MPDTPTRVTLHVPAPSPRTWMSLGKAWTVSSWNSDGFCATSEGRIWLDARGSAATSTFGALANGGQLLAQSLQDSVYVVSREAAIVATTGGAFFGGGNGVKLLAGHGAPALFAPNLKPLANVAPSEEAPSSELAASYTTYIDDVATAWTITDTVMAASLTALDVGLAVADCYQGGSFAGVGACLMLLGSAANIAGGAVNIAGMEGATLPGLNLHASANITLATTGFCSVYSGAGMLLCGLTTGGIGFLTAGVTASVNAALKSLLMTTVEGKSIDVIGGTAASLGARFGPLKTYGPEMLFGSKGGEAKSQMPTLNIEASAVEELAIEGQTGNVELQSMADVELEGDWLKVDGGTGILIKGPTYDVKVLPTGVMLQFGGPTKVVCNQQRFQAKAGSFSLTLNSDKITLGSSASKIEAKVGGIWKWQSPQILFS